MVHKLANVSDLDKLPTLDRKTKAVLYELTSVLTNEYGAERDVDYDDGGYVLYVTPGTSQEEIKRYFDYSAHQLEYANREWTVDTAICSAMYILNNERVIVLVLPVEDAPAEIIAEMDEMEEL